MNPLAKDLQMLHRALILPTPTGKQMFPRFVLDTGMQAVRTVSHPEPVTSQPERNHKLKQARLKLNYTQTMLADFAQVSPSTIARAERGDTLRVDSIQLLCQFFSEAYGRSVTADELGLFGEVQL